MSFDFDFDVSDAGEMRSGFELMPKGWYEVQITEMERKATKTGNGEYIVATLEVLDEAYRGRKLWARMNISNPSKQAVDIGKAELKALSIAALGHDRPRHGGEYLGKVIRVEVIIDKKQENRIAKYESIHGAKGAQQATPPASAGNKAPWQK